ncbi:MAG: DUF3833 domain-containing protein [Vogesella sp.]|jgi:hypothetical protein|uniref:DUF3833 domain-containing protein n=1 Tax=Vogesella sp. TaxID=1904252 RepID=UPI0039187157
MMARHWLKALLLCASVALAGCSTASLEDYRGTKPALDLQTYFNGPITAQGVFQDRSGKVVRRFTVQMTASWQGDTGVLDEHFTYDDGEKQRRVWTLKKQPDGRYTGTADDVVGEASGRTEGFALFWDYTLRLPVDGEVYEVRFDDWMYQLDERTLLNRSVMSKWGVKLGEVTLFFRKGDAP